MAEKRLFLLDSFALAFRMFYAYFKSPLVNSAGLNVSLVHGYWGAVLRILAVHKPTHFAIARDVGKPTFRHELYPEYKANRGPMPEEMAAQMPLLQETLTASGISLLAEPGYEADDVMASAALAAERAGFDRVIILSKDKDMSQIVDDCIHLYHLEKGADGEEFGPPEVLAKYGVLPQKIRDYLALVGDASDNVPGVPKVGPKTAADLLNEYGDIDNLYANLDRITKKALRANLEAARENLKLSRELVTLQTERAFSGSLDALEFHGLHSDALADIFKTNEINSLLKLLEKVPSRSGWTPAAGEAAPEPEVLPAYELVNSDVVFEQMNAELSKAALIAVDTETDGLDSMQCKIVGLNLCAAAEKGYYIPLGHTDDMGLENGNYDFQKIRRWFLGLWEDKSREWIFHNAKFDLHVLSRAFDFEPFPAQVRDTLVAAWMLSPGETGLGLDEQVRRRLNHEMIPIENLIGRGKNQITFNRVSPAAACDYGAEDAVYTFRLWGALLPELRKRDYEKYFLNQEMPLLRVLFDMEREGVAIDSKVLAGLGGEMQAAADALEKQIYTFALGKEFNIGSTKQLAEVLFDDLKLPVIKKTQSGRSTDNAVLEQLAEMDEPHPIVFCLMEYRELKKLLSTYVTVLPTLVNPLTHRIHTSFIQWGTATGRLSSRDPNLQNIPVRSELGKKIRAAFVPECKDNVILSVDYSQIELRMLAHLSGDEKLIASYVAGEDIHARTAASIFGVDPSAVTADMRRDAKVVNFGVLYGMTAFRLARDLKIPRGRAKDFIDGYFNLYKGVEKFIEDTKDFARKNGYVETLSGRRRFIAGIDSHDHTERMMAERMAVNTPVQGSAADLIKIAMIRIAERIREEKLPLRMILQVHDELVFECPRAQVETLAQVVKGEMERAMTLKVPLIASVGYGDNWLAAH